MNNETTSVRINSEMVKRIKKHVIDSRQTISGFIEIIVEKRLDIIERNKTKFLEQQLLKIKSKTFKI